MFAYALSRLPEINHERGPAGRLCLFISSNLRCFLAGPYRQTNFSRTTLPDVSSHSVIALHAECETDTCKSSSGGTLFYVRCWMLKGYIIDSGFVFGLFFFSNYCKKSSHANVGSAALNVFYSHLLNLSGHLFLTSCGRQIKIKHTQVPATSNHWKKSVVLSCFGFSFLGVFFFLE